MTGFGLSYLWVLWKQILYQCEDRRVEVPKWTYVLLYTPQILVVLTGPGAGFSPCELVWFFQDGVGLAAFAVLGCESSCLSVCETLLNAEGPEFAAPWFLLTGLRSSLGLPWLEAARSRITGCVDAGRSDEICR